MDKLSTRLSRFAKREELAARPVSCLFRKFALGDGKGCFAVGDLAFRDRPRAQVFVVPGGATRVTQEDLGAFAPMPESKSPALCLPATLFTALKA